MNVLRAMILVLVLATAAQAYDESQYMASSLYTDTSTPSSSTSVFENAVPGLVGAAAGAFIGYRFGGTMGAAIGGIGGFLVGQLAKNVFAGAESQSYDPYASSIDPYGFAIDPSQNIELADSMTDYSFVPAASDLATTTLSAVEAQTQLDAAYIAYLDALRAGRDGLTERDAYLIAKDALDATVAAGR